MNDANLWFQSDFESNDEVCYTIDFSMGLDATLLEKDLKQFLEFDMINFNGEFDKYEVKPDLYECEIIFIFDRCFEDIFQSNIKDMKAFFEEHGFRFIDDDQRDLDTLSDRMLLEESQSYSYQVL